MQDKIVIVIVIMIIISKIIIVHRTKSDTCAEDTDKEREGDTGGDK
jgi:hypothetical protein